MAADPKNIRQRNLDIHKAYKLMQNVKEDGITKFSHEYMLAKLAKKFYLSVTTIEKILKLDLDNG